MPQPMRANRKKLNGVISGFISSPAAGGIILILASVAAIVIANSPLVEGYESLLKYKTAGLSTEHWVNDGLMVVFFFLIGLEVRQEFAHGSLRDRSRARLALIAGVAGVVLPALVYVLIVGLAGSEGLHGWGAVVGTDTAFMLGTLAIVGPRLSGQLRVFLLTLTVVDDFLAVSIIGIVYSEEIRVVPLLIALASLVGLWLLGRTRQWRAMPYVLIVIVLWLATVYSGIHASLAGMAAGLLIPAYATQRHGVVAARQLFRDFWQSPSAASARAVDCGLSRGISVNERLHEFLRLPTALLIVLGGTMGAVMLQSPYAVFLRGIRMVSWVWFPPVVEYRQVISQVSAWSHIARREGLLAREGEQALDQLHAAARRLQRRFDEFVEFGVIRTVILQRRQVADDDGEQVVEIVGDAASQLAQCVEFLRLQQLFLQFALLGHIADHRQTAPRADGPEASLEMALLASPPRRILETLQLAGAACLHRRLAEAPSHVRRQGILQAMPQEGLRRHRQGVTAG